MSDLKWSIHDTTEVVESSMVGYVKSFLVEPGPKLEPKLIRNWFEFLAVFEHGLTQYRIYREGYLDKIMISGLDKNGNRVHVFVDKRAKTFRKKRDRWFPSKKK